MRGREVSWLDVTYLLCCILRHFHKIKINKNIKLTEMEFFVRIETYIMYGNCPLLAYNGKHAILEADVNTKVRVFR